MPKLITTKTIEDTPCQIRLFVKHNNALKSLFHRWYFGNVSTKKHATSLLLRYGYKGTFLVRCSETNKSSYAISVRDEEDVKHYRIVFDNKRFSIEGDKKQRQYASIEALIEHYTQNRERLSCKLITPCNKEDSKKGPWEISPDRIEKIKVIGKGHSSTVHKGKWNGLIDIAIKEFNRNQETLVSTEIETMKKLRHPHLVMLFGICTSDPPSIILEYMSNGSLLSYVKRNRCRIDLNTQVKFATEITDGMCYLEQNEQIHRDLAARNVLVSGDKTLKIADFGLSGAVTEQTENRQFAIRWMPPEVLADFRFSVQSDVWSFGVLLTEIVTKGETPYKHVTDHDVRGKINAGEIMAKPDGCDNRMYNIMKLCWKIKPEDRPSFSTLKDRFVTFHLVDETSEMIEPPPC